MHRGAAGRPRSLAGRTDGHRLAHAPCGAQLLAEERAAPPRRPGSAAGSAPLLLAVVLLGCPRALFRSPRPRRLQRAPIWPPAPRRWLPYAGPVVTAAAWCASPTENSAKPRCKQAGRSRHPDTQHPPPRGRCGGPLDCGPASMVTRGGSGDRRGRAWVPGGGQREEREPRVQHPLKGPWPRRGVPALTAPPIRPAGHPPSRALAVEARVYGTAEQRAPFAPRGC